MNPVLKVILIVFGILAGLYVLQMILLSVIVYVKLLVRTSKKKWTRDCGFPDDEEYVKMFNIGLEWGEQWKDYKRDVDLYSGKYHLFGEYYDFGHDRAAIIIAGRTEGLRYSYYFAEPYRRAGFNVLVIDNRSHGRSDGVVNSLGFKEYADIIEWSKMLHDAFKNKSVWLHGICIGSEVALFTAVADSCPDYVSGLTVDGMFTRFKESFLNHMTDDRRPKIAPTFLMFWLMRVFSGANVVTDGPYKRIEKLKKPILMLHSREDKYSIPPQADYLYEHCTAPKELVWFESGKHSRIRINHTEKYDEAIISFLKKHA